MWGSCRTPGTLEYPSSPPTLHHDHSLPIDTPVSVTKSPGPVSSVHTRSPINRQPHQHLQPAQHCTVAKVTQRVSACAPPAAPATGVNGHANILQQHHHCGKQPPHSAEKLRQHRLMLLKRLSAWLFLGIVALVVLGSLVPAAELQHPQPTDVLLDLGPYFFNPSIVRHRGVYLSTARTAHMKRIDRTNWWFNEAYICMSTTSQFKSVSCRKFDPWQG